MTSLTREQVMGQRDLLTELEARGVRVLGTGNQRSAKCPFHDDKNPSFSINVDQGVWNCKTCSIGGSVIDLIAQYENRPAKAVYRELASEIQPPTPWKPVTKPLPAEPSNELGMVFERDYIYRDIDGNELFRSKRYKVPPPKRKTFRFGHFVNGQWIQNLNGVNKVLYRLDEISKHQEVFIVEGEKDAETLWDNGFPATTNPGGRGGWLEIYGDDLVEKDVVFCGDNDDEKGEHIKMVRKSLEGKVKTLRVVEIPKLTNGKITKDVTDFLTSFPVLSYGVNAFKELLAKAIPIHRGIELPAFNFADLRLIWAKTLEETLRSPVDIGRWLPGFRRYCRPLIYGDLVTIIAATAAGKTAVVQNLMYALSDIPTVFFELELSGELVLERFLGMDYGLTGREVEEQFLKGDLPPSIKEEEMNKNHLVFNQTQLSVAKIEEFCRRSELRLGRKPRLVVVDYIQLMGGEGDSRYERFSDIAEGLRSMALRLKVSVIVTCQCRRKDPDNYEVSLSDGKESGSIENSSSLVLGVWREETSPDSGVYDKMIISILKNTRGKAGSKIECNWNSNLRITEISPTFDP